MWLETRFWLITGFIGHLQNVTTNNYVSATELHIPHVIAAKTHEVFTVSISCCLVADSNCGRSSSPGFSTATQYSLNFEFWVTLQLAVYRQLVRLGAKPLEAHDKIFTLFSTLSDERDGFVAYEQACPLSTVHIAHVACYLEIFPVLYIPVLCQSRHCKADHVCPLWWVDRSVIYSYNSLSLSGPSPTELVATSYCLIWDYWVPLCRLLRLTVGF
jgi:hypothetical protein